jgi:hypothetical protein
MSIVTAVAFGVLSVPHAAAQSRIMPVEVVIDSPQAVGAYQLTITYDPKVVRLNRDNVTGGTGAGFTKQPVMVVEDNATGQVFISSLQIGDTPTGRFTVASLGFTPVAAGTTTLIVSDAVRTDPLGDRLPVGTISLSKNSITVGHANGRKSEEGLSELSSSALPPSDDNVAGPVAVSTPRGQPVLAAVGRVSSR